MIVYGGNGDEEVASMWSVPDFTLRDYRSFMQAADLLWGPV